MTVPGRGGVVVRRLGSGRARARRPSRAARRLPPAPRRGPSGTTVISGPCDTDELDGPVRAGSARPGRARSSTTVPGRLVVEHRHGGRAEAGAARRRARRRPRVLADDVGHGRVGAGSGRRVPPGAGGDRGPRTSSTASDPAPPAATSSGRARVAVLLGGPLLRPCACRRRSGRATVRDRVPRGIVEAGRSRRCRGRASSSAVVVGAVPGRPGRPSPGAACDRGGRRRGARAWPGRATRGCAGRARARRRRRAGRSSGLARGERADELVDLLRQPRDGRDGGGMSELTCWNATWIGVSPVNGCRPVSISYSRMPAA